MLDLKEFYLGAAFTIRVYKIDNAVISAHVSQLVT